MSNLNEASKKQNRRRNISVCVRMTQREKNIFGKKVKDSGLNRTDYFIRCALNKTIKSVGDKNQISRLIYELNRIGVNLNQIAKKLNEGNYYRAELELKMVKADYEKSLDAVLRIMEEVCSK